MEEGRGRGGGGPGRPIEQEESEFEYSVLAVSARLPDRGGEGGARRVFARKAGPAPAGADVDHNRGHILAKHDILVIYKTRERRRRGHGHEQGVR